MSLYYCNAFERNAAKKLKQQLQISIDNTDNKNFVILCIGTDRATGDCLGPLVGNKIKEALPHIPVYGTIEKPVHALNLEQTIHTIFQEHKCPYVIAIDASLGTKEHIGYTTISNKPLAPGKGVNKNLPAIGNLSITGIVNISGFPNAVLLQSTRLHIVMTLADCIGTALQSYLIEYYRPEPR